MDNNKRLHTLVPPLRANIRIRQCGTTGRFNVSGILGYWVGISFNTASDPTCLPNAFEAQVYEII